MQTNTLFRLPGCYAFSKLIFRRVGFQGYFLAQFAQFQARMNTNWEHVAINHFTASLSRFTPQLLCPFVSTFSWKGLLFKPRCAGISFIADFLISCIISCLYTALRHVQLLVSKAIKSQVKPAQHLILKYRKTSVWILHIWFFPTAGSQRCIKKR